MSSPPDEHAQTAVRDAFGAREFPFTRRDFRRIAELLNKDSGIAMAEMKAPLVYGRLVRRLRELGIENFRTYCELVETPAGAQEREKMIAALTTNVTRFFREPHHFEHLRLRVLPDVLDQVRHGARLRIWSAGCSTGEEPYSIALTILSVMRDAAQFDVKVLATDISKTVLERACDGVYEDSALAPLSRQQRIDWFTPLRDGTGEKTWRVGEELRALVAFRELNLMADWPMTQAYQAIFCRNVVIYFEDRMRTTIWKRFAGLLARRGCLYVGHSERVREASELRPEAYAVYRLSDGGRS